MLSKSKTKKKKENKLNNNIKRKFTSFSNYSHKYVKYLVSLFLIKDIY